MQPKGLSFPTKAPTSNLCARCQGVRENIWTPQFSISYDTQVMQSNAVSKTCDLCELLWRVCQRLDSSKSLVGSRVLIQRDGSSFTMDGMRRRVMSIFRSPGAGTPFDDGIQIGFPGLPAPTSQFYFEIIRQWLQDCDCHHNKTCPPAQNKTYNSAAALRLPQRLPTRVIRVGTNNDEKVHLRVTTPDDKGQWAALSHQWGAGPHFSTTDENFSAHINGLVVADLPATFRDAVVVTRALGIPYLWVDSLCIIQDQGPGGDFDQQAKRMEHVYSGAYCVLAPTRKSGHYAGFLQERSERHSVALRQEGQADSFYICETIDDFNSHVLEGDLNSRGWVLQEHALARRTIYFSNSQTYFECGNGVRCETMMRMTNEKASFLGDPNFPQVIMNADQGKMILLYQGFYKMYSHLGLTHPSDRPMAIDGLQERIISALGVKGGFGVFDEGLPVEKDPGLLRRSLLWRRDASVTKLNRVQFLSNHKTTQVPSWSWMAYSGGIDYVNPPFGAMDWNEIESPWSANRGGDDAGVLTDGRGGNPALIAVAQDYKQDVALDGKQYEILLDSPGGSYQPPFKCVVLGRERSRKVPPKDKLHYVLIIRETTKHHDGKKVYERVGVGSLPADCIDPRGSRVRIH